MNKLKLVRIILKDLEEIKLLSEEVTESENDSALIIDLALSRTRLLCQEFELLRELSVQVVQVNSESEEDLTDDDEFDVTDVSFSDPELEILNFEENEFPEDGELTDTVESENEETEEKNPEEEEEEEDDFTDEDQEELTVEEDEEAKDDLTEEEGDEDEETEDDLTEEDEDDDDLTEDDDDEDDLTEEDKDEEAEEDEAETEDEEEEPQPEKNLNENEIKYGPKPGVREIVIEEMDEDLGPIKFSTLSGSVSRPVMHEIPKPENPVHEKIVVGESFHKERSVNDVIGENKAAESSLNNGPITSLRASIGLNDRFLFIREIFNNNTDKYNTVIDQLDKLETIQQAVELLKANLSLQKNETSMKFVDLLKRRFSK